MSYIFLEGGTPTLKYIKLVKKRKTFILQFNGENGNQKFYYFDFRGLEFLGNPEISTLDIAMIYLYGFGYEHSCKKLYTNRITLTLCQINTKRMENNVPHIL